MEAIVKNINNSVLKSFNVENDVIEKSRTVGAKDKMKRKKHSGSWEKHLKNYLQEGDSVKIRKEYGGKSGKHVESTESGYHTIKHKDGSSSYYQSGSIESHYHKDSGKKYKREDFEQD